MKKLSSVLYSITRKTGKAASRLNDIETLMSGNPKKIAKRIARKATYKGTNNLARSINNLFK